jgi:hypothetical protein
MFAKHIWNSGRLRHAGGGAALALAPTTGGTDVTLVSSTGGYAADGFAAISHAADHVFAEQLARLKAYVETGSPENSKEKKP